MSDGSRSAAYACALIVQDGKVLLGRRAHFRAAYPNCWDFIGGKIEAGETAEQALTRELSEEIAITPSAPVFFDTIEDTQMDATTPPLYHFYKVTAWQGGAPVINNHEHAQLEWFTQQQACDLSNLALDAYRPMLAALLS